MRPDVKEKVTVAVNLYLEGFTKKEIMNEMKISEFTLRKYLTDYAQELGKDKYDRVMQRWEMEKGNKVHEETAKKAVDAANYIIENDATFSEAAVKFSVTPASIQRYINTILPGVDYKLYLNVRNIVDGKKKNGSVRIVQKPQEQPDKFNVIEKAKPKKTGTIQEIYEYMMEHKCPAKEAALFFGITKDAVEYRINSLVKKDYDKYLELKKIQIDNYVKNGCSGRSPVIIPKPGTEPNPAPSPTIASEPVVIEEVIDDVVQKFNIPVASTKHETIDIVPVNVPVKEKKVVKKYGFSKKSA